MKTKIFTIALIALVAVSCNKTPNEPANPSNPSNPSNPTNPTYVAKGIVELINNSNLLLDVGTTNYTFGAVLNPYEQTVIYMKQNWYTTTTIRAWYLDPKTEEELYDLVLQQTFEKGKDYRVLFGKDEIKCYQITE